MKRLIPSLLTVYLASSLFAQTGLFDASGQYTRQDTLRGFITPERAWWDLLHYDLRVNVDIPSKAISGVNIVKFKALEDGADKLQIDLQAPMKLVKVTDGKKELTFTRDGNAHFIQLTKPSTKGREAYVHLHFEGKPVVAKYPPWDGGFTWQQDSNGKPFIANSNQGIGASVWWPNKDHGYDEPNEGLKLSITVPNDLVAVGNGRLVDQKNESGGRKTYVWEVKNPINNYGVNVNIGDYVNFKEVYEGESGALDMDYWVLRENEQKAKKQFREAPRTIEAFEHWFGPYPFYQDSYKLVEVPYLGMEHQSSVTYGNSYKNGYNGRSREMFDWSGTGWGTKFDYIIVHETGHEWFANNITAKDIADMWIHESFTTYSEVLFLEYHFGKKAAQEYVIGTRRAVTNQSPIIGVYNVHQEGSSDMYMKGSNVLHTLRQVVNDDETWRKVLRGLNLTFRHQTVTTQQVEQYIAKMTGKKLDAFFDQYLRDYRIPILEWKSSDGQLAYRWADVIDGFDMPIDVTVDKETLRIHPTTSWKTMNGGKLAADENYYIKVQEVN